MSEYFTVTAIGVSSDQEDLLSGFFFENGAEGVSEELEFQQLDDHYNVETQDTPVKILKIYFLQIPDENILLTARALFSGVNFEITKQPNQDWMAEWKKGFHSFSLVAGVQVVPSWESPQQNDDIKIFIDPGMAFGTGTHSTTQMAAELLGTLNLGQKTIIDVGTGTAILAILSEKYGAKKVVATEIDETARGVAKENLQRNHCKITRVLDHQIDSVNEKFDVVMANIIDGVLVRIQKDLCRAVPLEGHLLLTGILCEREASFVNSFDLSKYEKILRLEKQEWVGILLKKVKP